MGRGWSHNYSERILPLTTDAKRHIDGRGSVERYHCVDAPTCSVYRSESTSGKLLKPLSSGWELLSPGGELKSFDSVGKLVGIENTTGAYHLTTISYTADDTVDLVMDQQGRSLKFNYNADGLVASVTLPSGDAIQYRYKRPASVPAYIGWNQQLTRVIREDLSERIYHYEDQNPDLRPRGEFLVTGVTDENSVRYSTFEYDERARPISSELAGGADRVTLNYTKRAGETENWTMTRVTRPLGEVETYSMSADAFRKPTAIKDTRGDITINYDPVTTWRASRTDREGNQTTYTYADSLHQTRRTEAAGTPAERVIETDWDNTINRIIERREPGKTTRYTYNARGQKLSRTEIDTNTFATRSWTYNYHEIPSIMELVGQLKVVDGPRTDVSDTTSYDYYTSDDPGGAFLKGDLHTITNALGQVTEYLAYDGNGRPLQVEDPNHVVTTLSYHPRGWIQSRTTDGQMTAFIYDNVGNLMRVTQPDGSFSRYEYDAAHRLIAIADNFNNRIEYTLDAAGNRTVENTLNDVGALKRQMGRVYDQLNRLQKVVDGNLDETVYGYDNNNNRTSIKDPNFNNTMFEYDPLDRLTRTIDTTLGDTLMTYDARDNLASVSDPLGNTTQYSYDGLDNQVQLSSPDTRTTTYEYDAAGNRTTSTDARGVRVDYVYDALNRLTVIDYADNTLDVTFTYDAGANGTGRLTSMTDAAGSESYGYDARGNVTSVVRVIDESNYTTGYQYNGADRVTKIVYPSGMGVDYTLDAAGRVIAVDKTVDTMTENLVNGVVYEPYGPVSTYAYGNGLAMNATFDQDYELAQLQSGTGLSWLFGHDAAGNILNITDQNTQADSQTFGYDSLYRLTTAAGGYGNESFEYDANGNRTRYLNDMVDDAYTYEPSSNRMTTQSGWSFDRDAAGNRLNRLDAAAYGKLYRYGEHNRLSQVSDRDVGGDTVAATYTYDGRGQRVSKTAGGITTHFVYGLNGELLGEINTDGSARIEYVYFNGQPIAVYSKLAKTSTPPPSEIIIDNNDPSTSKTGRWKIKTNAQQYGVNYRETRRKKGVKTYRWSEASAGAGTRDVYAWWVDHKSHSKRVKYTISYAGGSLTDVVTKNQRAGGGQWQWLGRYDFSGTTHDYIEVRAKKGKRKTAADAIRFVASSDPVITQVERTDFIHVDHLGTPRVVTDNAGTVVWRWDSTPFGELAPDDDPDGDGNTFTLNLRFPGQYYDAESGLNYNYFRTYDPVTGRYIESDPIGLDGGINTFSYSNSNPLLNVDPQGLWVKRCARKLGDMNNPPKEPSGNPIRHDYLSVSGKILSFQAGDGPFPIVISQGKIDRENEYPANPKCKMICNDDNFDKYVFEAAREIGAPTYCIWAYPGTKMHLLGARNCQTWANDVLTLAKQKYFQGEDCPKCFK